MAEQDPDPPGDLNPTPRRNHKTYIVQVPKDQVYRVPPPENASIAESYRYPDQKKKKKVVIRICGCSLASCIGILVAVVVFIGMAVGLSLIVLKPKHREFAIQQLIVENPVSKHSKNPPSLPYYHITLNIENPDEESTILYKPGGITRLSCSQQEIATGKFPAFHQQPTNTTRIAIALRGSGKVTLPKKVQNSVEGAEPKESLELSLDMNVPIRTQLNAIRPGDAKLKVACNFTVDKLAAGAQILSQDCEVDIV